MNEQDNLNWGIEQTQTHNWIGPLRVDGKVNEIVCHTDREGLTDEALARNDRNARLLASSPALLRIAIAFVSYYPHGVNPNLDNAYSQALEILSKEMLEGNWLRRDPAPHG